MNPKYNHILDCLNPKAKTPLQVLINEVYSFIEGKGRIAGLNGAAGITAQWAKEENLHPDIIELASQIQIKANSCWNEWGLVSNPIEKDEFIKWLKKEIIP